MGRKKKKTRIKVVSCCWRIFEELSILRARIKRNQDLLHSARFYAEFPVRTSPPLPVIAAEINMSDRELHLATVPGEDVFNPKARRFEHEELRPLPVMRKAKKVKQRE